MRLCTVATLANQQLQSLIDEPQEFRASGTSVRDDMDSRGTDAIFGEHFWKILRILRDAESADELVFRSDAG